MTSTGITGLLRILEGVMEQHQEWKSGIIANRITSRHLMIRARHFNKIDDVRMKKSILLSFMSMPKNCLDEHSEEAEKIISFALNDEDDFVRFIAHVLKTYPSNAVINKNVNVNIDLIKRELSDNMKLNTNSDNSFSNQISRHMKALPRYAVSRVRSRREQHFTLLKTIEMERYEKERFERLQGIVLEEEESRVKDVMNNIKAGRLPNNIRQPTSSMFIIRNPVKSILSTSTSSSVNKLKGFKKENKAKMIGLEEVKALNKQTQRKPRKRM